MPSPNHEKMQPTRQSLLSRLKDWDDHDSWREFFDSYWRLIYDVARRSGLEDAEAQDVVQETIVAVARQMPDFRYDPTRGRFRSWLRHLTRCRIADQLRRRYREPSGQAARAAAEPGPSLPPSGDLEALVDPATEEVDAIWNQQWEEHLATLALERIKRRIRLEHYQVFDLYVLQGWSASKVAKTLGVSLPLVYVIRHRVGALLKKELETLRQRDL